MGKLLTITFFIFSILSLVFGVKWLLEGDLFYGILNVVLGAFNFYNYGKCVFKKDF